MARISFALHQRVGEGTARPKGCLGKGAAAQHLLLGSVQDIVQEAEAARARGRLDGGVARGADTHPPAVRADALHRGGRRELQQTVTV